MDIKDMKIEEVADLINNALKENKGVSVNKICDTLRIKRSTLKSRLTRGGYSFNADKNRYELITTKEKENSNANNTTYKATQRTTNDTTINITNKPIEHTTDNKKRVVEGGVSSRVRRTTERTTVNTIDRTTQDITDNNINHTTKHTTDRKLTLEERITALERAVEMLKGNTRRTTKGITITNTKDTTVKSVRLYSEVKEELDKYIAEHKEIKVIDIISNAIIEYIKRH